MLFLKQEKKAGHSLRASSIVAPVSLVPSCQSTWVAFPDVTVCLVTMNPNPINEFLPATATPDRMDLEVEFDMARWQALKKDKQDELKRLEEENRQSQTQLEMQLEAENQQLLSQVQLKVQESIQQVFVDLQLSIAATIDAQVGLRLQQQRLRDEHAASTAAIEQRHVNKITDLMAPSSTRVAKPHEYDARNSLTPKPVNFPVSIIGSFQYLVMQ